MNITRKQLLKIVKEEIMLKEQGGLGEQDPDDGGGKFPRSAGPAKVPYQIYPEAYIKIAEEFLTPEELENVGRQKLETIAVDVADELAYRLEGSMEGFGTSDATYEYQAYLEALGFKTGFSDGKLEVVRENEMNITREQLLNIVKEEYAATLIEQPIDQPEDSAFEDMVETFKDAIRSGKQSGFNDNDIQDAFDGAHAYIEANR